MHELGDDKTLLAWVVLQCQQHLATDDRAKEFLRRSCITDESVWAAYRIGSGSKDLHTVLTDADKQRLHKLRLLQWNNIFVPGKGGFCVPTFDPKAPHQPVGYIKCAVAQNKHHWMTAAAGVGCTPDVDKCAKIVLCDSALLAMRLTQLGVKGVVIVETPDVLSSLKGWLKGKEIVAAAYKTEGVEALTAVLKPLNAFPAQIQPEIWKTAVPCLEALGLRRDELYQPPEPEPVTAMLLHELVEYAQGRLKVGMGVDALKALNADNPEFVEVYGLGFLPKDFRASLAAEDKRQLTGNKIANCIIMPAYDEQGAICDAFAVHPDPRCRSNIQLAEPLAGLIAYKVASAFDELIVTDSFRLTGKICSAGYKNSLFLRGLEDAKLNAQRLRKAGVRKIKLLARREAEEIASVLEATGIAVHRLKFANNISEIDVNAVLNDYRREIEPVGAKSSNEADGEADATGITVQPELVRHDLKTEQAYFSAGAATYTVEAGLETGTKLEVRLERSGKVHLDRFDLAAEAQRKRFATGAALKTQVPYEVVESHLIYILDEVRALQDRLQNPMRPASNIKMDAADRELAVAFLQRKDLLDAIANDMAALGWVGEETTKRLLYLVSVSRKLPMPLSAAVMAASGAGKSKGVETVAELTPSEDIIHVSRLTDSALYYHDKDALRHKLFVIDEADALTNEVLVALRVLQSRGALSQSHVARDPSNNSTTTHMIEARGPVAVVTSSAGPLEEQMLSRCYQIAIDESVQQTQRILEAQRKHRMDPEFAGLDGKRGKILRLHHNLQRLLDCVSVIIPFANRIEFPSSSIKHRRIQERFLNLIEASALLHQYQRLKQKNSSGDTLVIAAETDFSVALGLAAESINRECDDLSANARDVLDLLVSAKLTEFDVHTLKSMKPEWTRHKFRAGLDELIRLDVLSSTRRTKARRYRLTISSLEFLKAPTVRLLPAGDLARFGETASPNSSSAVATG